MYEPRIVLSTIEYYPDKKALEKAVLEYNKTHREFQRKGTKPAKAGRTVGLREALKREL